MTRNWLPIAGFLAISSALADLSPSAQSQKQAWSQWLEKENQSLKTDAHSPLAVTVTRELKPEETAALTFSESPRSAKWSPPSPGSKPYSLVFRYSKQVLSYRNPEDTDFKPFPKDELKADFGYLISPGRARPEGINVWVYDPKNPEMQAFKGMTLYPFDPSYVVRARFEPYEHPNRLELPRSRGDTLSAWKLGKLRFQLKGVEMALEAFVMQDPKSQIWSIPFTDKTNGKTTYPAGRYLEITMTESKPSEVELDFNRAFQPYCAYNHAYSCVVPPASNRIAIPIEAGQRWDAARK